MHIDDQDESAGFHYHSDDRRGAVRVITHSHNLVLTEDMVVNPLSYQCLNISVSGCALADVTVCRLMEKKSFLLHYDNHLIGNLEAKCIYQVGTKTGWQFLQKDESVDYFIETFVLDVQKKHLREAKEKRITLEELTILGLDKPTQDQKN